MINLFFIEEAAGREVRRFCFMGVVAFVSFRGCKWIISLPSLYIANTAPRNATGHGRGNELNTLRTFFNSSPVWQ